jgi:hypothetical protein
MRVSSASTNETHFPAAFASPPLRAADAPIPRGKSKTVTGRNALQRAARALVSSLEPSFTTSTSSLRIRCDSIEARQASIVRAALRAGMIIDSSVATSDIYLASRDYFVMRHHSKKTRNTLSNLGFWRPKYLSCTIL